MRTESPGAPPPVSPPAAPPRGRSDLLAVGFGTSVAMWATGYVARFPGVGAPGWLLMALLLLWLLAGGVVVGRLGGGRRRDGALAGLLTGLVNLLILGSLLGGERPGQVVPSAVWWLPGSLLVGALLGAAGAVLGRADGGNAGGGTGPGAREPLLWRLGPCGPATVAAAATFLLLVAGGIVTSQEAGLAVVDWPNSYGYSMFLYPLSRMTGGIYYEHGHRLLGTLVGLTTLVLAFHLQRVEPRARVRRLGWAALLAVAVQGVLGGLRVTGHFTLSDSAAAVAPSLTLAVVHGVLGQLVFGLMVVLATVTAPRWRGGEPALPARGAQLDRSLTRLVLAALLVQIGLGALLRHLADGLMLHITLGLLVALLVVAAAVRVWSRQRAAALLGRLATLAVVAVVLQILLGLGALIALGARGAQPGPTTAEVALTTAHQAGGALLLAAAVALMLWVHRLLQPEG